MAALNPKLVIRLDLDPAGFVKGVKTTSKGLGSINKSVGITESKISGLKKSLASMWRITGGIILFNIIRKVTQALSELINVSLDFEEQMYNVNSVAQLDAKAFADLTDQVLSLALDPRIKDGPAVLAAGLYEITSAGYTAKDALVVLEEAATAATAGMTTTDVAADVLISTLGAYNLGVEKAGFVTNQLFQIVNISKYTFEDLASSLASVTPVASKLGVGLDEVGAAMATMAKQGVGAETSTVQLNAVLTGLLKPTDAMKDALAAAGYSSGEAMIKAKGLGGTLEWLNSIIGGSAEKSAELFGDVRALRGIIQLTTADGQVYADMLVQMGHAQDGTGAKAKALEEQMKSNNFQIAVLQKNIEILAILGFGLLAPYLSKALTTVNALLSGTITSFRKFRDKGLGFFDALAKSVKKTMTDMFGPEIGKKAEKVVRTIEELFYELKGIVQTVGPIVVKFLLFLVEHFDILGPAILGAVVGLKAFAVAEAIVSVITAVLAGELAPVTIAMLAIAAIAAVVAVAWAKNWFDIRGKTKVAMEFIGKWLGKAWEYIKPVIDTLKLLGGILVDVAQGDITRFGKALSVLPGWLQPLALVMIRVVKTVRVFFKVWQNRGFLEAIKTIPVQIRAFARAFGALFTSMGLTNFGKMITRLYADISYFIQHLIDLVDDVVHGRWKEVWEDLGNILLDQLKIWLDLVSVFGAFLMDVFNMIPWGTVFDGLRTAFKVTVSWLWNTAIPWMVKTGWEIMKGLGQAVSEYWDEHIGPWFRKLGHKIRGHFHDAKTWLVNAGGDVFWGFWGGVTDVWNWGVEHVLKFKDWIVGYFVNAKDWLVWAGHDIVNGLWEGILSVVDWMKQHWNALWSWMPDSLEKKFVIQSPSKVFAEIGEDIPAGLWVGIEKGMEDLQARTKRLLDAYLLEVQRRVDEATMIIQGQQKVRAEDNSLVSPSFYTGNSQAFNEWSLYYDKIGQFLMAKGQDYFNWLEWRDMGMTIARAIQEGFITEMQISSPSKVFMKFGKELPRGLALGIRSEMGLLERTMGRMGELSSPASMAQHEARALSSINRLSIVGGQHRQLHFERGSIIVNGAAGQNEDILAEKVASRIIRASDDYKAGQK